jgi:hypothetical protein
MSALAAKKGGVSHLAFVGLSPWGPGDPHCLSTGAFFPSMTHVIPQKYHRPYSMHVLEVCVLYINTKTKCQILHLDHSTVLCGCTDARAARRTILAIAKEVTR